MVVGSGSIAGRTMVEERSPHTIASGLTDCEGLPKSH
jgi:hypothetical protein